MKNLLAITIPVLRMIVSMFGALVQPPPRNTAFAIYDANLQFRNTTDSLTQTETSAALKIGPTPAGGLNLVIDVPKKSVGDTMQLTLQHSTDNSTFTNLTTIETVASVTQASTVPFKIVRPIDTQVPYVRTVITVAGTSPDFGAVKVRVGGRGERWQQNALGTGISSTP